MPSELERLEDNCSAPGLEEQNYIVLMNAIPVSKIATDRELFTFNDARPAPVQQSGYGSYNLYNYCQHYSHRDTFIHNLHTITINKVSSCVYEYARGLPIVS